MLSHVEPSHGMDPDPVQLSESVADRLRLAVGDGDQLWVGEGEGEPLGVVLWVALVETVSGWVGDLDRVGDAVREWVAAEHLWAPEAAQEDTVLESATEVLKRGQTTWFDLPFFVNRHCD